jgi:hypothetical protein
MKQFAFFSLSFCSFLNLNVIGILFQLQLEHHLQLQPTTIWVAIDICFDFVNNEYFRLIFCTTSSVCNLAVVRVAINVHSKLQILSASALYCTTPPLQLQLDNGSSCNWYTLWVANTERFCLNYTTPSVATQQWYEVQLIYPPSCKYWVSGFHLGSGDTSCNWSMTHVVIEVLTMLQLECLLKLFCYA